MSATPVCHRAVRGGKTCCYTEPAAFMTSPSLTVPEVFCVWVWASVSEWVSLCVLKTVWISYIRNRWREFRPVLVTYLFGFIDVLVRFLGWKGQGHSRQWAGNLVNTVSQKPVKGISLNFGHRCIWVCVCADEFLESKGQRSRSQEAEG